MDHYRMGTTKPNKECSPSPQILTFQQVTHNRLVAYNSAVTVDKINIHPHVDLDLTVY